MKCASAYYLGSDPDAAAGELSKTLEAELGAAPSWVLLTHTVGVAAEPLRAAWVDRFPQSALHQVSSFGSTISDGGFHRGPSATAFAVLDESGGYGAAFDPTDGDVAEGAAEAVARATERAGRPGEAPALVLLSTTPGIEEDAIRGIEEELGQGVPIVGGTAADDTIAGEWSVADATVSAGTGLVVSVFFSKTPPSLSFSSGYVPEGPAGLITSAEGRTIREIDGRPAVDVYNEWTEGHLASIDAETGGSVLAETTLRPLGRKIPGDLDRFLLAHPASVEQGGGIGMFACCNAGEVVHLMTGSVDSLVSRAGRVANSAVLKVENVRGGLIIYCAGCMLAVGDHFEKAQYELQSTFGAPFSGVFSFGEQGPSARAGNLHGNLMVSAVVFHGD